jgi:5'-nucleotidase
MSEKPVIFITNDDGITSGGIRTLIEIMRRIGNVVVVAPDKPQSGTAHAITINVPLRLRTITREPGYEEYSCNGTPADCVKLGFKVVLKGRPDLLVSGINHGSNASINVIYSGTMAAVFEGAMSGVPSIGFSLLNYSAEADFYQCREYVKRITEKVLAHGLPDGVCLNVNIPDVTRDEIAGIRICRQAGGTWEEDFDERIDPVGSNYYWLKGIFVKIGNGIDTDEWALENNWISIVPVHTDFTAHSAIPALKSLEFNA